MNGPLSVADYMAHCLGDPAHGYYTTRDPFGATGDFITAPEISQMFGEIVGAWLIETWRLCGAPSPVRLVELGPGRGTLMADILRVASRVPEFSRGALGPSGRDEPRAERAAAPRRLPSTPAGLAPAASRTMSRRARCFSSRTSSSTRCRSVSSYASTANGASASSASTQDGKLVFGIGPGRLDGAPHAAEGEVFEIRPAGEALIADIAARIAAEGGAALVIDYGHAESAAGDTLQAMRGTPSPIRSMLPAKPTSPRTSISRRSPAHARPRGVAVHGPITQGEFLLSLGLAERAEPPRRDSRCGDEERAARSGRPADLGRADGQPVQGDGGDPRWCRPAALCRRTGLLARIVRIRRFGLHRRATREFSTGIRR